VYEWLIVGGGPIGVHVAAALRMQAGLPRGSVGIVDPEPTLMASWNRRAAAVGMTHLRSPSVHHVDVDPWSLQRFAEDWTPTDAQPAFAPPYSRPSTALFAAHSAAVIERLGLSGVHHCVRVEALGAAPEGWTADCSDGASLRARRVVLALGSSGTERIVPWARSFIADPERWLQHVFDPRFDLDLRPQLERVAVIGGGISAVQVANRLASQGRRVTIVTPHRLRRSQFDSSPQWLGPAKMAGFSRVDDLATRRRMIDRARRPGTITRDVERTLRAHRQAGRIDVVVERVRGVYALPGRRVLGLSTELEVDAVALATGFSGMPTLPRFEGLAEDALPRARCGTPVVDAQLQWARALYVTGALAELQLGPIARNIAGGRRAAERLVPLAARELRASVSGISPCAPARCSAGG